MCRYCRKLKSRPKSTVINTEEARSVSRSLSPQEKEARRKVIAENVRKAKDQMRIKAEEAEVKAEEERKRIEAEQRVADEAERKRQEEEEARGTRKKDVAAKFKQGADEQQQLREEAKANKSTKAASSPENSQCKGPRIGGSESFCVKEYDIVKNPEWFSQNQITKYRQRKSSGNTRLMCRYCRKLKSRPKSTVINTEEARSVSRSLSPQEKEARRKVIAENVRKAKDQMRIKAEEAEVKAEEERKRIEAEQRVADEAERKRQEEEEARGTRKEEVAAKFKQGADERQLKEKVERKLKREAADKFRQGADERKRKQEAARILKEEAAKKLQEAKKAEEAERQRLEAEQAEQKRKRAEVEAKQREVERKLEDERIRQEAAAAKEVATWLAHRSCNCGEETNINSYGICEACEDGEQPAKQLAEKIQELLNAIGIIGIPPMEELMNKLEKRKSETGDANMKLQIAVVKKFLQQQAEEKRQADEEKRQGTEAKQQPAQPQSTGTSWGWLGSALNSIKTALTTPLSRNSRKNDDSSSYSSSASSDAFRDPAEGSEENTSNGPEDNTPNSSPGTEGHSSDKGRDPDSAQGCPFTRRRLVNHAAMEVTDVGSMSASEILLRRRRLASDVHVSPVLTALMDEIEEARRNHSSNRSRCN